MRPARVAESLLDFHCLSAKAVVRADIQTLVVVAESASADAVTASKGPNPAYELLLNNLQLTDQCVEHVVDWTLGHGVFPLKIRLDHNSPGLQAQWRVK